MGTLLQDIRYGIRTLLKTPAVTFIAVLSLALGIGANTAIFSIIDALMLRSLPVKDPGRLVLFGNGSWMGIVGGAPGTKTDLISERQLRDFRKASHSFEGLCGVFSLPYTFHAVIAGAASSENVHAHMVTGNFFSVLGVNPAAGRLFSDAEDSPYGAHPDVVISYDWWKRRFGSDKSALGKSIRIGDRLYTIVGVTPREFFGAAVGEAPDLWIPLSMQAQVPPFFDFHEDATASSLYVIGRLTSGVSIAQATAEVDPLYRRLLRSYAGPAPSAQDLQDIAKSGVSLTPAATGISHLRQRFSLSLRVLMIVVALVLLIACANVANLLLARATARAKEMAIRVAVGSGRIRLLRQLLTESLMLSVAGGAFGILLAMWGTQVLVGLVSSGPDRVPLNVDPDVKVLVFTLGISLCTGIFFGLAPAFRGSSMNLGPLLKEGRGETTTRARMFAGRSLVVFQVALSLMLLIGAGLFVRSLRNLEETDTGFAKRNVLRVAMETSAAGYKQDARLVRIYQTIEERVSAIPGVHSASFSMFAFGRGSIRLLVSAEGHPNVERERHDIDVFTVGNRYLETLKIPVVMGRSFEATDRTGSPKVAVINQKAAREMFGNESPIGRHISLDVPKTPDIEIVGVAKNAKYEDLREDGRWVVYIPYTQRAEFLDNLLVSVDGPPASLIPEIRRAINESGGNMPITEIVTLSEDVDRSVATDRLIAQLSAFFGALALLLAAIGLYGILSYSVTRRTGEIGIRMALGAQAARVLRMILRETAILVAMGVLIGVPLAVACSGYIESMLYGLKATDAPTIGVAIAILALIGALAGLAPARRAANVDPMVALRHE